jgi:hypothetical protein
VRTRLDLCRDRPAYLEKPRRLDRCHGSVHMALLDRELRRTMADKV